MRKNIAFAAAAALVAFGHVAFAADYSPDSSPQARQERMDAALRDARTGRPAADESVGTRIKHDATDAGHAIRNGATDTGHAIRNGAHRAGHAVSHAASATGHAISNGVHRTGRAIHDATHPAPKPTSGGNAS